MLKYDKNEVIYVNRTKTYGNTDDLFRCKHVDKLWYNVIGSNFVFLWSQANLCKRHRDQLPVRQLLFWPIVPHTFAHFDYLYVCPPSVSASVGLSIRQSLDPQRRPLGLHAGSKFLPEPILGSKFSLTRKKLNKIWQRK